MTRLRSEEAGFTLVEMLVAMSVGMLVLFALLTLVDQSMPATARITARVDAQQRGRIALEQMEQQLHSAVCLDTGADPTTHNETYASPVVSADANQVTFYSGLVGPSAAASGSFQPLQVQFSYDPTSGRIAESRWTLSSNGAPWTTGNPVTSTTLTSTRQIIGNVSPVSGNAGVFTEYGYDPTSGALVPTTDHTKIAQVGIAFTVAGRGLTGSSAQSASLDDSVSIALPTDFTSSTSAANGPGCSL